MESDVYERTVSSSFIPQKECACCGGTGLMTDDQKLGACLKYQRVLAGKLLREVAESLDISIGYLSDMESGRKSFSLERIDQYQKALAK